MTKVLITGAGGYIGSEMVERFLDANHQVIALDRFFFGDTLRDLRSHPRLRIVEDDIRRFDPALLEGVDCVIDLASISNDPASELLPELTDRVNREGAIRVARLAKAMGVRRLVFSSSCSVYGAGDGVLTEASALAPVSAYARSKIAAEEALLGMASADFSVTVLRNATVYGLSKRRMRFDLIVNIMTLHALRKRAIQVHGPGRQWRPLVHLRDVVRCFERMVNEEDARLISGQVFNVGCDAQNYQVCQVAEIVARQFGDLAIETRPGDVDRRSYRVGFGKLNGVLGWLPSFTVADGIREIRQALLRGAIADDPLTRTVEHYKGLLGASHGNCHRGRRK